ncbi:hypothetical protein CAEBREN_01146 [Caenorhabditis brenneri]|uniref:Galectin domain-containing protein n=1 Tax=Caenorhabditis brenneri TaxID=135651 RepID=G0NAB8_CAEBE|nr:hypothetical protein CAEBREN_01146 [Caenorhabditis brenneri]
MHLVILFLFFFPSTVTRKPDTSENLKMIVINGNPVYSPGVVPGSRGDWTQCLEECRTTWNCALVTQTATGCDFLLLNQVKSITPSDSGPKVAFKMNLVDQCPSGSPPLSGNPVSKVIESNGIDFFETEVTSDSDSKLIFNYTVFKCLKDFPENPVLRGEYPIRVVYPLTSKFLPGEEFFMKGKIRSTFNGSFSISFFSAANGNYPLFIKVINGWRSTPYTSSAWDNGIELSTWYNTTYRYPVTIEGYPNPFNLSDAFEIRVNSSDTQVFVYLNGTTKLIFDLEPRFPLETTDQFIINDSGYPHEKISDYYFGWTGECWWEPME